MIVIVLIPVFGLPGVRVFIPPFVFVIPAPRAGDIQFFARLVRFRAIPTVLRGSFMQMMVGLDHAILAVIRTSRRRGCKKRQSRGQRNASKTEPSPNGPFAAIFHNVLPFQRELTDDTPGRRGPTSGVCLRRLQKLPVNEGRALAVRSREINTPAKTGRLPCGTSRDPRGYGRRLRPRCPRIAASCIRLR